MRNLLLACAATGTLFAAASAQAATATGNLDVTASVAASCVVIGNGTLNFGAYDPVVTNNTTVLNGVGSMSIRCTKGSAPTIQLGQGANGTGGSCVTPTRRMLQTAGTDLLPYTLYRDSARTQIWGCDVTNQGSYTSANSAVAGTVQVWGQVPAGQNVGAGNYSDTVVITLTY